MAYPESKDEVATGAWADDGIVQKATRAIKREVPGLLLMGDVCLCEYMSHGHCGLVDTSDANAKARGELLEFTRELEAKGKVVIMLGAQSLGAAIAAATGLAAVSAEEYEILNDPTLELLARTAVAQAKAGMDIIAPSRHDGRPRQPPFALRWTKPATRTFQSCRMRRSLPADSTALSARPPIRRRTSAIAARTRWIRPTYGKPCARSSLTWKKAPT